MTNDSVDQMNRVVRIFILSLLNIIHKLKYTALLIYAFLLDIISFVHYSTLQSNIPTIYYSEYLQELHQTLPQLPKPCQFIEFSFCVNVFCKGLIFKRKVQLVNII